ncbi:hypothetical protein [Mesorhizobium sp. B263B2A]|uniref:hypothetical protein n=1 Tax=Mesorhizobium sp. B263B2A TaxID=2876669 RepID=UPI001CD0740E|nr:hypothetical protein [Mesorhizobium sp. B263B2A]MCA0032715.1 hypothetical protein [Mesorhizobium sp. B263B2A]
MNQIAELLSIVDAYMTATGRKETTVSTTVFNDGKKLTSLRDGTADIGTRRYNSAIMWFAANWPDGAVWPDGVARPMVEQAA